METTSQRWRRTICTSVAVWLRSSMTEPDRVRLVRIAATVRDIVTMDRLFVASQGPSDWVRRMRLVVAAARDIVTMDALFLPSERQSVRRIASQMPASVRLKVQVRRAMRAAEFALWIVAAGTLGYCSYAYTSAAVHQSSDKTVFLEQLQNQQAQRTASFVGSAGLAGMADTGKLLGLLEIPKIGLSSAVEEGDDSQTLLYGVGHVPGTVLPGESGNAALAAHRDTYFRQLGKLEPGDVLTYRSLNGTYTYTVESTKIVDPSDTAVLEGSSEARLTLVTCYPFYYIGNAPKRFIVFARETTAVPQK